MKKFTKKDFIERAMCILGDNYDFSKTSYINSKTKTIITCKTHGDFFVLPSNVIEHGCGCPECGKKKISRAKTLTTQAFIAKATRKHCGFYDYRLVKYINSHTKIKIVCPIHGIFEQTPNNHLKGCGCPKC